MEYTFDGGPTQGDRVVRFIEKFLTLGGSFLGQPFVPLPWMRDFLREVYRLDPETGRRMYRMFLLGVPRKNAKSMLGSAIALYQLIIDESDPAPVVISAAGDRKQARLVFDEAARMVRSHPDLKAICEVRRDEIRCERTNGVYRVVSADAGLAHGLNPSTVIVDELHVHKNDDLLVALTTGSAMRNEPLTLVISTAGWDLDSPLGRLYQYGRRIESGEVLDPTFGMWWFGPRENEQFDPGDPEVWERFNPSWSLMNQAEFSSAYKRTRESEFIRYRLNGWTSSEEAWFAHGVFEARADNTKPLQPGEEVVLGFDGAWKGDSTALVACRISDYHLTTLAVWEAPIDDPHWRTPVRDVEEAIRQAFATYRVRELAADPYRFELSLLALSEEGYPIVEFPTNALARMVPATKDFYDAVVDGELTHDGNPSLLRHVANAILREDAKGARLTKEYKGSKRHIDLAVAAVVAYHRARVWREEVPPEPRLLIL